MRDGVIVLDSRGRIVEINPSAERVMGLNVARGSGIGLAVVKSLVQAQRGRVGVESTPGTGSCFWFELPASPTSH